MSSFLLQVKSFVFDAVVRQSRIVVFRVDGVSMR